ncbi:unnamed protein product, partial [Acanthoscelides obtectus]
HLPRKLSDRGIPDLVIKHNRQVTNLKNYFFAKAASSEIHHAIIRADSKATPLRLADQSFSLSGDQLMPDQQLQQWKIKALHGKYRTLLENDNIDTFASTAYLRSGNLFAETEGFISAIQDRVIATKVYKRIIMRERQDNIRCRVCGEKDEYLDHIIAGCSMLASKSYLDRHNRVGKIIHQSLREKYMGLTEIYVLFIRAACCMRR